MNEQRGFCQWVTRMLAFGLTREQIPSIPENHRFQQEAWIRALLKEAQKKRHDFHAALEDTTFYVVDTETTGFYPELGDEIIAIAAAKTMKGDIADFYFSLIKPNKEIPEHITELTGIANADVQLAPLLSDEIKRWLAFVETGILVGYHIAHDLAFINYFLWKHYRTRLTQRYFEIGRILEVIHGKEAFPTLDEALHYYSIPCEKRHSADGDVKATVRLWKCVLYELKRNGIETLPIHCVKFTVIY